MPRRSSAPPSIYASAEEVELNFRERTFVLGDNNEIAEVRPLDWRKDKFLKLPFWFGVNILVPGVMAPKEGDFYVISEATLEKPLDTPGEWMIEAGSSLVKQETVFVTTRTQYSAPEKFCRPSCNTWASANSSAPTARRCRFRCCARFRCR